MSDHDHNQRQKHHDFFKGMILGILYVIVFFPIIVIIFNPFTNNNDLSIFLISVIIILTFFSIMFILISQGKDAYFGGFFIGLFIGILLLPFILIAGCFGFILLALTFL